MIGGEEASEIAMFALMMDRFFDCLNVGNYTSGKYSRNAFKQPYRSSKDFRLNVRDCFTKYTCTFLDLYEYYVSMVYIIMEHFQTLTTW